MTDLLRLSWRYLWSRPLATVLNLWLLTLGLATVGFVLQARSAVDRAFARDLAGIDLVVGAKGSPMQVILAGVFHMDVPPGNIPLAEVQTLAQHPMVAQVVPLSLGDNLQGYRIVGTTPDYPALYGMQLAAGTWWARPMEAVLGARVAAATGLGEGQGFVGAHGLGRGGAVHEEAAYHVTGVMAPCGCVLDRLVLTPTESVWQVHDDMHGAADMDAEDLAALQADREVTIALVCYRSPLAAATLPRLINDSTGLQAAAPAVEVTRLLSMLGVGTRVLQAAGAVLLLVAGLSVFMALWHAVRERAADLAILRLLGAGPGRVTALLLLEALWLAMLACGLSLLLARGLWWALARQLADDPSGVVAMAPSPLLLAGVPLLALAVVFLAVLLPAIEAYRQDVHPSLNPRS